MFETEFMLVKNLVTMSKESLLNIVEATFSNWSLCCCFCQNVNFDHFWFKCEYGSILVKFVLISRSVLNMNYLGSKSKVTYLNRRKGYSGERYSVIIVFIVYFYKKTCK